MQWLTPRSIRQVPVLDHTKQGGQNKAQKFTENFLPMIKSWNQNQCWWTSVIGWNLMKNQSQYWLTSVMRKNLGCSFWTVSFYSERWTAASFLNTGRWIIRNGGLILFWMLDGGLILFWMLDGGLIPERWIVRWNGGLILFWMLDGGLIPERWTIVEQRPYSFPSNTKLQKKADNFQNRKKIKSLILQQSLTLNVS